MAAIIETSHSHVMQITIAQVSKLDSVFTSEVVIHGIPWKVQVLKDEVDDENQPSLAVRLICANRDKSLKWSISGAITCKLLPFSDDLDALECRVKPDVFDHVRLYGIGFYECIKWDDLFDENNKYVKDDTIKMEIKIDAENLNDPNRSGVKFQNISKSRLDGCLAIYRLTITNVSNLMAIRSPRFGLRGLFWNITVGKNSSTNNLFAHLDFEESMKEISCDVTWIVKLMSSKKNVEPIGEPQTEELLSSDYLIMDCVAPWNLIFKPENGFVNNDSIVLEIEIKTGEPNDPANTTKRPRIDPKNETISPKMECPICFENIDGQDLSVTPCGHLFCLACITNAVTGRAVCPTCNKAVRLKSLRRLFLPM